jgi:hypothetical protein
VEELLVGEPMDVAQLLKAKETHFLSLQIAPGPGYIHWNSQNPGFVQGRSINDVVFNNTWHHVVAQSDGSSVRIYENGYLVRAATYANNVIDTNELHNWKNTQRVSVFSTAA